MTKGIKVIWPDENDRIDEIEYYFGIDIDDLNAISPFNSVRADWPGHTVEPSVLYNIDVSPERKSSRKVHLSVTYHPDTAGNHPVAAGAGNLILIDARLSSR